MARTDPTTPDAIKNRIRKCRTADVTLTVTDARGRPLPNAAVTVRQTRHKFLFGCHAFRLGTFEDPKIERAYRKRIADLMNFATLPFYWGLYEPKEGKPSEARVKRMARWCASKGIRTKGHPLCWHATNANPEWLPGKTLDEAERLQLARISREVEAFKGLIDTWDVINETVVMPVFSVKNRVTDMCKRRGRVEFVRRVFGRARRANPRADLLINDFVVTPQYKKLIRDSLAAGVRIDTIGIQSHMHERYWGLKEAWAVCERFKTFAKPIHFTELTILSGRLKRGGDWISPRKNWHTTRSGEERQARQVEELYSLLFSHPAVEAITFWDFTDANSWMRAPSGLVRKDMSPKPAYEALMRLVKGEWWTDKLKLTTDAAGRATFRGYLGDYQLRSAKATAAFFLAEPGTQAVGVRLNKP